MFSFYILRLFCNKCKSENIFCMVCLMSQRLSDVRAAVVARRGRHHFGGGGAHCCLAAMLQCFSNCGAAVPWLAVR